MPGITLVQVEGSDESHAVDWEADQTGKRTACGEAASFPLGGSGEPTCPGCLGKLSERP
jgi:hypothetical protein